MCELGQRLREAREAKGISLAEAADLLKMRRVLVEALEECRFELLPEQPLARGYIRRYAKVLGLEADSLLALYPGTATEIRNRPLLPRNPTLTGSPTQAGGTPKFTPAPTSRPNPTLAPSPVHSAAARPAQRGSLVWLWAIPLGLLLGMGGWWYLARTGAPAPAPAAVQQPAPAAVTPPAPRQVALRISTQPAGARVFLDGFLLGQAPLEARIEEGERTLRVEAQGFQSYERVLTLDTDRNLSVALKRTPTAPATPGTPAANPSTTPSPANPANPANPAQPAQQPTQGGAITIRMDGRSWIRVVNPVTGQELYEGIPAQGAQLNYPSPVLVRAGNAGAVRVIVAGQDRGLMGREGQVLSQRYGQ
ncbi:MAG: DUF4115 domain-containing protein [Meiothermus sp.]|nr:DUF4115 domain-containing protein [Meiothermus sp.]